MLKGIRHTRRRASRIAFHVVLNSMRNCSALQSLLGDLSQSARSIEGHLHAICGRVPHLVHEDAYDTEISSLGAELCDLVLAVLLAVD